MPTLAWFRSLHDPQLDAAVQALARTLERAGWAGVDICAHGSAAELERARSADAVLVWSDQDGGVDQSLPATLAAVLDGADAPVLVLAGPTLTEGRRPWASERAGLTVQAASGVHDVRVRAGGCAGAALAARVLDHEHDGIAHLGAHAHLRDAVRPVRAQADVQALLTAQLGLTAHPVAAWRPATRTLAWTLGAEPGSVTARAHARLLLLVLHQVLGRELPSSVGVALLGYGAIGHEHSRAVQGVPGLHLAAVCDRSSDRLKAAEQMSPGVLTTTEAQDLLEDPAVDLVIVSTPPVTHAHWARLALLAGKHVVVEKPFCLTTVEADEILALAAARGLFVACYQNRRFDPDHRAIRAALEQDRLGEVFHVETFVGGYGHPCNLWHSDAAASGGAFYDWGAHVVDQLLDLLPQEVVAVEATEQKRVWLDVTNADHSRLTLRFAGGAEASFVYSDLAAALKPRWYLLGTRGAVVGHWRTEKVVSRSAVGTLAEDVLAPADSPPVLELHDAHGSVTRLALPAGAGPAFHRDLADAVQLGLPPEVTGHQARRVVAVLEAALASVAAGGGAVAPAPAAPAAAG